MKSIVKAAAGGAAAGSVLGVVPAACTTANVTMVGGTAYLGGGYSLLGSCGIGSLTPWLVGGKCPVPFQSSPLWPAAGTSARHPVLLAGSGAVPFLWSSVIFLGFLWGACARKFQRTMSFISLRFFSLGSSAA